MGYFIMAWLFYRRLAIFMMASLFGGYGAVYFFRMERMAVAARRRAMRVTAPMAV